MVQETRSSVHYAKDRLDHSFLFPGLDLEKDFILGVITRGQWTTIFLCIGPFSVWWQPNEGTTKQPGDSSASLLLTTVRRQSFAIIIQNWVLCGQILRWTWLWKVWSGLVLVGNYQKINFQTQGVPATCDWVNALWLQRNSENAFFGTPCIFASLALSSNPFPSKSF